MLDARRHIDIIQKKYDPENDTIPGAPAVTWTDMQLAYVADRLRRKVLLLEESVEELKRQRRDLEERVERLENERNYSLKETGQWLP